MADNRPEEMKQYYAKNDSIPVMDSLLMNRQIIKSGMGYDTTKQPIVGNRYDTVNSIGGISAVSGKAITMKADSGFVIPGSSTIDINATLNFGLGRYYYQDGYGNEKSNLTKSYEMYMFGELQPGLPEPEEPEPAP